MSKLTLWLSSSSIYNIASLQNRKIFHRVLFHLHKKPYFSGFIDLEKKWNFFADTFALNPLKQSHWDFKFPNSGICGSLKLKFMVIKKTQLGKKPSLVKKSFFCQTSYSFGEVQFCSQSLPGNPTLLLFRFLKTSKISHMLDINWSIKQYEISSFRMNLPTSSRILRVWK